MKLKDIDDVNTRNNQVRRERLHKTETDRRRKIWACARTSSAHEHIPITMPEIYVSLTHGFLHMTAPPTCTCWPAVSDILASSVASKSAMATYTSTGSNSSSFIDPGTL